MNENSGLFLHEWGEKLQFTFSVLWDVTARVESTVKSKKKQNKKNLKGLVTLPPKCFPPPDV